MEHLSAPQLAAWLGISFAGFGLLSYRLALSAIAQLGAPGGDAG